MAAEDAAVVETVVKTIHHTNVSYCVNLAASNDSLGDVTIANDSNAMSHFREVHHLLVLFETTLPCQHSHTTPEVHSLHSVLHGSVLTEVSELRHSTALKAQSYSVVCVS